MSDSSGLIDDNDVFASETAARAYLARVGDPKLRAQLLAIAARIRANRAVQVSPLWFIRLAAWQPLVAPPGTTYHHSNIGWNIAGLIAAKAPQAPPSNSFPSRELGDSVIWPYDAEVSAVECRERAELRSWHAKPTPASDAWAAESERSRRR